ncbi:hypothetical protein NW752_011514 [Fusarium irregulare]|uniref:Uncharacterized protein n=1 Tax=Fusarium irregulare TaxID=2494466 RepID=A0A9W8UD77_9HYPO|nr:hypothetical protein NW752_011514 [Fusarium irregulare]KAJ4019274.1 hypothetical protein NW766_002980 [Fusarium irregulare]
MAPRTFLSLPHELRHMIYREYFTLDKGYAFQPGSGRQLGSGKLGTFDGEPLDLALMYTCRFIASETKDMPLTFNTISFSTVYRPEWRKWAGRFDYLLNFQEEQRFDLLIHISQFLTPEIDRTTISRLWDPERLGYGFSWDLSDILHPPDFPFKGTPPTRSALCSATDFTLRLLAEDPNPRLAQEVQRATGIWGRRTRLTRLLDEAFTPWDIPECHNLNTAGERLEDDRMWSTMSSWRQERECKKAYQCKFRFSAVSVAVRFFKHLPIDKRRCIRNVVVLEDHIAAGQQERHAVGLIPFCKENSRLKIDLRLDMVGNVFQTHVLSRHTDFRYLHTRWEDDPSDLISEFLGMDVYEISSRWLIEALALKDAGMPSGSFTFTLDGGSAINLCSEIFQQDVLRSVSISKAAGRCLPCPSDTVPRNDLPRWLNPSSIQAFEHLVNQTSFLWSNFHPGSMWNVDQLIADRPGYNLGQWKHDLFLRQGYNVPKSIYIPPTDSIVLDNFETRPLPKRSQNRTD